MRTRNLFLGLGVILLLLIVFLMSKCGKRNPLDALKKNPVDRIDLNQTVTSNVRPVDSIFIDFEKNWTKFVTSAREVNLPVLIPPERETWEPVVTADCIFSEGAGAVVPKVTLSWVERDLNIQQRPVRFDISVHYQGFERDFYTTIYPIENLQRFKLPQSNALARDTAAVLLTGTSIFPKVVDFNEARLPNQGRDPDQSGGELKQYTLVIQDLGPGLSYHIRMCRFNGEEWIDEKEYVFTTPICTQKF